MTVPTMMVWGGEIRVDTIMFIYIALVIVAKLLIVAEEKWIAKDLDNAMYTLRSLADSCTLLFGFNLFIYSLT